jgi:hypothetical protein
MADVIGCTTATATHLAGARVVAASWRHLHPGAPFRILLADADPDDRPVDDPSILVPEDLGLDRAEIRTRRVIYDPFEFATSLKADFLRFLLREGAHAVVFTDSDTDLYAPLDALTKLAADVGICLTSHVLRPLPADGRGLDDWALLKLGVYNTGLVAVGRSALPFLDWWADRLRRDCLDAKHDGFWVEQRWVDLGPTYFSARIVADPTLNVAFWNLHERQIEAANGRFEVNGEPLRHFHFSNFDPEQPWALCGNVPDLLGLPHRTTLADQPALKGLFEDYAQRLLKAGHRRCRGRAYAYAAATTGRPLTRWDRLLLREVTLAHEAGAAPAPPDPFEAHQRQRFTRFTSTPISSLPLSAPARSRLTRAHVALADRRPAGRRERLVAAARRLVGQRLSIEQHGLVTPSAEVLAEYGYPPPTPRTTRPPSELGATAGRSHERAADAPIHRIQ